MSYLEISKKADLIIEDLDLCLKTEAHLATEIMRILASAVILAGDTTRLNDKTYDKLEIIAAFIFYESFLLSSIRNAHSWLIDVNLAPSIIDMISTLPDSKFVGALSKHKSYYVELRNQIDAIVKDTDFEFNCRLLTNLVKSSKHREGNFKLGIVRAGELIGKLTAKMHEKYAFQCISSVWDL